MGEQKDELGVDHMSRQRLTEEQRKRILADHAFLTEKMGQLQGNLERMERESTTSEPTLDRISPANLGMTQFTIDQALRDDYASRKNDIEKQYPNIFKKEE